jgi:alanine dehydrogenase
MNESLLTLGVIGTAHKPDERRAPIDPSHLERIPSALRDRIWLQRGYGERFGVADDALGDLVAGLLETDALHERCDIVLLAKPTPADFPHFRDRRIVWGWPHCVQGEAITQTAIDKRLTLIAWEAMNHWQGDERGLHVFFKNNELAGYCAVLHALRLAGRSGRYGPRMRAAVIEFGLTARGAIHALRGLGFSDITCYTQRPPEELPAQIGGVRHPRYDRATPLAGDLATYDVVVNCIFQDTDHPVIFVRRDDLVRFRPGTLLIDVSCDLGMGFEFARPTSFANPTFEAGNGVVYYGVDHTPSYLWRASTWEISRALLPYLPVVMGGPAAWDADPVVSRAIEIREGRVVNPKILSAQNRAPEYPHPRL